MRIVAGIDALQRQEAPEHQTGTNQQDETQRDLRHHHGVAQQRSTAQGVVPAAGTQHLRHVGTRRPQSRRQPEQQRRRQARSDAERQHGGIDAGGIQPRQIGRSNRQQLVDSRPCQPEPEDGTDRRHQQRFRQSLARQPPPACAHGGAYG